MTSGTTSSPYLMLKDKFDDEVCRDVQLILVIIIIIIIIIALQLVAEGLLQSVTA